MWAASFVLLETDDIFLRDATTFGGNLTALNLLGDAAALCVAPSSVVLKLAPYLHLRCLLLAARVVTAPVSERRSFVITLSRYDTP